MRINSPKLFQLVTLAVWVPAAVTSCKKGGSDNRGGEVTESGYSDRRKHSVTESGSGALPLASWEKFLAQLDEISVNYRGPSGASERKRLIAEAVGTLEGGAGLGAFIEGLYERRETKIVDRLLEENKKAIFTGKGAAGAREWVMGVKDGKIKERLSFEAGYYYTGPGLKEYLGTLFPPAAQERFLTGYASRLAESEPSRAVEEYKALRPEKVSYYGLLDVMDRVDPDADIPKVDTTFPDDYDEANNMGAALRQRLLKRWASFHPEAAAKYVADTPKRVKPESVRVVIAKWAESKPEDAAGWLDKAAAGPLRDAGLTELAQVALKTGKPTDAWQLAAKVGDLDKRVKLATEVFKAWEQTDRAAAEKAWVELFPAE